MYIKKKKGNDKLTPDNGISDSVKDFEYIYEIYNVFIVGDDVMAAKLKKKCLEIFRNHAETLMLFLSTRENRLD